MDKRSRKELIEGLRDSLRNFEEQYDRSEWEHFKQQRNKANRRPIPLFVKLAGIAASLFLIVYASVRILPLLDRVEDDRKHVPTEVLHEQPDSLTVDPLVQPVEERTHEATDQSTTQVGDESISEWRRRKELTNDRAHQRQKRYIERIEINVPIATPAAHFLPGGRRNAKGAPRWPHKPIRVDPPEIGIWRGGWPAISGITVGANITPVFANKGFSLGAGVSVQLPLSNHLTTEIGVSYMNLKAGRDKKADPSDTISQQVVGMRNRVGVIAVPVSLNYAISENFSASLGLLPFRVVRDEHTDILQRYRWISNGDATGRLEGEQTRTKRADSLYMGNTYIGFIRLSGQYSPPILRQRKLVLAPFVSIPLGRLQKDEYRWWHGGVSVRWYLR